MTASFGSHIVFHECNFCMVTKVKDICNWPFCSSSCRKEAEEEKMKFARPCSTYDESCSKTTNEEQENKCSEKPVVGGDMQGEKVSDVETLCEFEKQPADFGPGKVYQEKIFNKNEPHDIIFFSRVIVQKDGALKQIRGTVSLRKGYVFQSWMEWRSFCWQWIY